jgi:hypothetical protein
MISLGSTWAQVEINFPVGRDLTFEMDLGRLAPVSEVA